MEPSTFPKSSIIKNLYFYLVSFVALMMVVFSMADLVNILLRTYFFPRAESMYYYTAPCIDPATRKTDVPDTVYQTREQCLQSREDEKRQNKENTDAQRQRDSVRDLSFLFVGIPLFAYHWRIIRKKGIE